MKATKGIIAAVRRRKGRECSEPKVKCWGVKRCKQVNSYSRTIWEVMAHGVAFCRGTASTWLHYSAPGSAFSPVKRALTEATIVFQ